MGNGAQHPTEGEEGQAQVPVGQGATPVEFLSVREGGREEGREGKVRNSAKHQYDSKHYASC